MVRKGDEERDHLVQQEQQLVWKEMQAEFDRKWITAILQAIEAKRQEMKALGYLVIDDEVPL